MVHEKAIYWMAVGILGFGLCNSLSRQMNQRPHLFAQSSHWLRHVVVDIDDATHEKPRQEVDLDDAIANARANAVLARINVDRALEAKHGDFQLQIAASKCLRERSIALEDVQ